jgi:hypothetical protein
MTETQTLDLAIERARGSRSFFVPRLVLLAPIIVLLIGVVDVLAMIAMGGRPTELGFTVLGVGLGLILFYAVWNLIGGLAPGARGIRVTAEGIGFTFRRDREVGLRWDEPNFRLRIQDFRGRPKHDTTSPAGRAFYPGSRSTFLSEECLSAILSNAKQHGLPIEITKHNVGTSYAYDELVLKGKGGSES